jgi:hypothetical protein
MKLIKLLTTLALVNAFGVIGLVAVGFPAQSRMTGAPIGNSGTYTPGLELAGYSPVPSASVQTSPQGAPPASPVVSARPVASALVKSPVATTATPTPTPVPIATPTPTPTLAPSPIPTPSNRCIVQIDGVSYDVATLRVTHSGGDIFVCGTDMSQTFWSRHNSRILQKMQQYKI